MMLQQPNELVLSAECFDWMRGEIKARTGISLSENKRNLVYNRLVRRLRALNLESFEAYITHLKQGDGSELTEFVNAITTNVTSFFRERHHFDLLQRVIVPEALSSSRGEPRLRLWSAGCSSGQEPYSMAISVLESGVRGAEAATKILATDLDTEMVELGEGGSYGRDRLSGLSPQHVERWFTRAEAGSRYVAKPELKRLITFRTLNLMESWPMRGPFDVIFCRNVIIYFDRPTQDRLIERFTELLRVGGYLLLGHSESVLDRKARLEAAGRSAYRKVR